MPTYQYRCLECDDEFEIVQKMTEDPLTECSQCKGKLKRLIGSGAGIIFKGKGFYVTDYRSESYKKRAAEEKKSSSGSTDKSKSSKTGAKKNKSSTE